MDFHEWVCCQYEKKRFIGAAEILGVSARVVESWCYLHRFPSPAMQELVALKTGGKVNMTKWRRAFLAKQELAKRLRNKNVTVALMGGSSYERSEIVRELMCIHRARIKCIDLNYLPTPGSKIERLKIELGPGPRSIVLINGVDSKEEADFLRGIGAHFAHVYGALHPVYDHVLVREEDIQVTPLSKKNAAPVHVMSAEEAVSEFLIRLKLDTLIQ